MAIRVNFTLPEDVVDALRAEVAERSRSAFVAEAVRYRLEAVREAELEARLEEGYRVTYEEGRQINADWAVTITDGLSDDD